MFNYLVEVLPVSMYEITMSKLSTILLKLKNKIRMILHEPYYDDNYFTFTRGIINHLHSSVQEEKGVEIRHSSIH